MPVTSRYVVTGSTASTETRYCWAVPAETLPVLTVM